MSEGINEEVEECRTRLIKAVGPERYREDPVVYHLVQGVCSQYRYSLRCERRLKELKELTPKEEDYAAIWLRGGPFAPDSDPERP